MGLCMAIVQHCRSFENDIIRYTLPNRLEFRSIVCLDGGQYLIVLPCGCFLQVEEHKGTNEAGAEESYAVVA